MTDKIVATSPQIIPVILCGGIGARLWPLTKPSSPKQFLAFTSENTYFDHALSRCLAPCFAPRAIIVGAAAHRDKISTTLLNRAVHADILLEPEGRDSCAAIVAAALLAEKRNPDSLILVMAADHHIPDSSAFAAAAKNATSAALAGKMVTFGIRPRSPATGYGYVLPGKTISDSTACRVLKFSEKPDLETAKRYLAEGYLWNSGNFLFLASTMLAEARLLAPEVVAAVEASLQKAKRERDFVMLDAESFSKAPKISVDHAIMERTKNAVVLPVDYQWSDLGIWDAVAATVAPDQFGNATIGESVLHNSRNCFVHSKDIPTILIGVDEVGVISTPDGVLVYRKGQSELLKEAIAQLNSKKTNPS